MFNPLSRSTPGNTMLIVVLAVATGWADDGRDVTGPLGTMTRPFAHSLDLTTFNPPEGEKTDRALGEILSLFDEFLEAQGISPEGSVEDLEKIRALYRRDYSLAAGQESYFDDQFDALKDELEELEDDLKDEKKKADLGAYLELKARSDALKEKRNLLRSYVESEEPVLALLDRAAHSPEDSRLRQEACHIALRNLYSLFADQFLAEQGNDPSKRTKSEKRQVIKHFVRRAELNATRHYAGNARNCPVGDLGAPKEALNLVDPANTGRFVTAAEMARLSHDEVSKLEVSPDNPFWHTHARMEAGRPDTWSQIENWISGEVTEELLDSKKFREEFPDFHYNLYSARKVLFWDDVKDTATSPKIDTVDAFGQEWKLKWGEETAVESVGNRLRLLLGAKFVDLTYADVGGSSHLLILPSALEKSMNPDKAMPVTRSEFVRVMKESRYDFNVEPFILSSGVVTEDNADSILASLPEEALKSYRKKRIIGRVWIRFRESMVEVKHDVIATGGPVTTHTTVASHDRATRQSMIVSFWMGETDIKEDNFRSLWIEGFNGKGGSQYLEYFHDPGSSMGGAKRTGEVNRLNYGYGTGDFLWLAPGGFSLYSDAFSLYRPGYFEHVTFADQLSGARHLARLSRDDISAAVNHSLMPDFYKACLVWRLLKRRDLIAELYGLPLPDATAGEAPEFVIPLTTREDRSRAASRYRIPLKEIEDDLVRTGHLASGNRAGNTMAPFNDVIVENGTILPYEKTVIPGILRDFRHPAGFVERMTRFNDGEPWQSRRFGMK